MNLILVVDDDKAIRDVLKDFLGRFTHKVVAAGDGKEGLNYFNSECFDLVITDITMPIMDGNELARAIRNSDRPDKALINLRPQFYTMAFRI